MNEQQYQTGPQPQSGSRRRITWSTISGVIVVIAAVIWFYNHNQSTQTQPCTSESCAVSTIERTLDGSSVTDGAVFTKVTCSPSSLANVGSGTLRADCTADYSDGTHASGYGTLNTQQNMVDFEPTQAPS
jgi:hypothetical protein